MSQLYTPIIIWDYYMLNHLHTLTGESTEIHSHILNGYLLVKYDDQLLISVILTYLQQTHFLVQAYRSMKQITYTDKYYARKQL